MAATVTVAGGKPVACRIVDIGASGCRIRIPDTVRLKGTVALSHQGRTQPAQVVWVRDGMAGLWFPNVREDEPEPSVLRRLWNQLNGR